MILSFINFIWIFICAFMIGFACCQVLIRLKILPEDQSQLDVILLVGLAALTAGAQWFSLVYRIGLLANAFLFSFLILIGILFFNPIKTYWISLFAGRNIYKYFLLLGCLTLLFSCVAATMPEVYDTALYHNQAIQWIEKFGVVKGLGNLHNRLAYNSSFFALQALFSWTSVCGQSLHGMNSFIAIVFSSYSLIRILRPQKSAADSDHYWMEQFLNLFILYYICASIKEISSPATDFLPMLLVLYLFSKWARNSRLLPVLFLLSLFGVTAKLSIAPVVIIGLPILFSLIAKRRFRQIFSYILLGAFLVLPFLIRNVIISGYLLYPFALLDLFPVDWKMPIQTVITDNHEIIAWGRTLRDVKKYDWPLAQWFPVWFAELTYVEKILFAVQAVGFPVFLICRLKDLLQKRKLTDVAYMLFVCIVLFLYWFFSAPLIRYGMVFLYLAPLLTAGRFLESRKVSYKTVFSKLGTAVACILCLLMAHGILQDHEVIRLYNPSDYNSFPHESVEIAAGVILYYPTQGHASGYDTFPSFPYQRTLNTLELRGTDLKDGFRTKDK